MKLTRPLAIRSRMSSLGEPIRHEDVKTFATTTKTDLVQ